MKRLLTTLFSATLFLGTANTLMSQSDEDLEYPPLDWKLDDARTVERVSTTRVTRNDSVLLAAEVKTRVRLKVIAVKDTVYEVEFQDITVNDKVAISSETTDVRAMEQMMTHLLADLQERMRGFTYVLLVDRTNAQAVQVKNEQAMARFMEDVVMVVLSAFFDESKVELSSTERRELELKLKKLMKEQMPAAIQTVLNSFNYLFQAYMVPYRPNGTHTMDVELYYVDAIKHGDKENTATQTIKASGTTTTLTLDIVQKEGQRTAYQLYVIDEGLEDQYPFSTFSAMQPSKTTFDLVSTWVTRHEASVEVHMGNVFTLQKEVSVFKR